MVVGEYEYVGDNQTSCTYKIYMSSCDNSTREQLTLEFLTPQNPSSINLSSILSAPDPEQYMVTRTILRHNPGEADDGKFLKIIRSDGTMTKYEYSTGILG